MPDAFSELVDVVAHLVEHFPHWNGTMSQDAAREKLAVARVYSDTIATIDSADATIADATTVVKDIKNV